MDKARHFQRQLLRFKGLPLLVIALTLLVLAAVIIAGCLRLRQSVRLEIVGRDAEILYQVARWQQQNPEDIEGNPAIAINDPGEQFNLMLKISQIKGVVGIRQFTRDGMFLNAFPATISEATLADADLASLKKLQSISHFYPRADLGAVDMLSGLTTNRAPVPLLEVNIPLHAGESDPLAGIGQFIISGEDIASGYAALDRHLAVLGLTAFATAGAILTTALALAFRKISQQTQRLLQTNQELLQAAKTAAVGAVTSHLIHGLKNPLSGLQGFVRSQIAGESPADDADWQDAMATTQHMQSLISGVVRILEEQQGASGYEISWQELSDLISARLLPGARSLGLHFHCQSNADAMLTNHAANLVLLILENLIQNAFQATPEGRTVRLDIVAGAARVQCDVQDEGPGISPEIAARLFTPCRSTKPGGSGIGLAISKQLAAQLGATLELKHTSASGCIFRLSLPLKRANAPAINAAESVPV